MQSSSIIQLSENLLMAVKMQQSTDPILAELSNLALTQIQSDLNNDDLKKAFWINIYNSFFQILRKRDGFEKPKIYTNKLINIAHSKLSLDDIEHGIIRRYRHKYSLGFLPWFYVPGLIKKLAVSNLDYRLHFALNCGAVSCPPIAFYSADKINDQLNMSTLSFLETETEILEERKEVHLSRLFLWFMWDFGGKSGIRKLLHEKLKRDLNGYKMVYKNYSWDEQLDNYLEPKIA